MTPDPSQPTQRFTDRVEDYVRYRPGYPAVVWKVLAEEAGFQSGSVIADVGSGTGISAEFFLQQGCTVYGIEPNAAMRAAAEQRLGSHPRFTSVEGTAERTTLPAQSVDFVTAAQAFHWFDAQAARSEFGRLLRPHGQVVLLWNTRRTDATPFMRAYEELLNSYSTDLARVRHENVRGERLRDFFGGAFHSRRVPNEQVLDFAGLRGRLLSSSYAPSASDPRHEPMLQDLQEIFEAHEQRGCVSLLYDTEIHFGMLQRAGA